MKQSIPALRYIAMFCVWIWFFPRFPKCWNWISPYSQVGYPCFFQIQDQTSYLYSQSSCKIWLFFFLNTSHPFLVDSRPFAFPSQDLKLMSQPLLIPISFLRVATSVLCCNQFPPSHLYSRSRPQGDVATSCCSFSGCM